MRCVTLLATYGNFGRVWYISGYISSICGLCGLIVCLTVTAEKEFTQTDKPEFQSIELVCMCHCVEYDVVEGLYR